MVENKWSYLYFRKNNLLLVCLRNTERILLKLNFLTSGLISVLQFLYTFKRIISRTIQFCFNHGCFNPLASSIGRINKCYLSVISMLLNIYLDKQYGKRILHIILWCAHQITEAPFTITKKVRNWGNNRKLFKMFRSIFYKNTMHWLLYFKHGFRMYNNILFIQDA